MLSETGVKEQRYGTPVEAGTGGVALLVGNGLLKQHQVNDGHTVGETCLAALERCAVSHGSRSAD